MDIFAPLAHRMGIWEIKSELEDTAFFYLYPLEYKRLNRKLRKNQSKHRDTRQSSRNILESSLAEDPMLEAQKVEFSVTGRMKELYSLWLKMETKYEHDLSRITDVVALRVVIDPEIKEGETEQEVRSFLFILGTTHAWVFVLIRRFPPRPVAAPTTLGVALLPRPRARPAPPQLPAHSDFRQGLHILPQTERLPVAPHGDPTQGPDRRGPNQDQEDAQSGREGYGQPLGLQGQVRGGVVE